MSPQRATLRSRPAAARAAAAAAAAASVSIIFAAAPCARAFDVLPVWPPLPPQFSPQWQLNRSTFMMPCNYSGAFDARALALIEAGGIADLDWSNERAQWSSAQPMDDEERLVEQCRRTKAAFPQSKCWVYKNLVKALPWMTDVREKLEDPAYSGWFLRFAANVTPHVPAQGSPFYHDQEQTPSGDCGSAPCGE